MTAPIKNWTTQNVSMSADVLDRMERAVENVRERLLRAVLAMNKSGVQYAVVGGHGVASWVAKVDEGAVRNCPDIDLLVYRSDLPTITAALQATGFVAGESLDVVRFLDGPEGKQREAINLVFAGEKMQPDHAVPTPDIRTIDEPESYALITLESLVLLSLLSNRCKDHVYVRDLIGVGLVDASWLPKLPADLSERLKKILDTPDD